MNPGASYFPVSVGAASPLVERARAWYCLRVMTRREHITALNLTQRTGVSVFSPRIRVQKRNRSGVAALVTEALFPGYVFARFNYPQEARHVASTPGVLGLVTFGGPPPTVADGVIDHLETEVNRAANTAVAPLFEEGAWVRIVTGSFQGSEGRVVQAAPGSSRVCVMLLLLGQEIQVSMQGDQLTGTAESASAVPAGLRADFSQTGRNQN
jgi:transcriptional antiterminator RfaH